MRVSSALTLVGLLACSACVTERDRVAEAEQMLTAAGFHAQPADTPERQRELARLTPHQLFAEPIKAGATKTTAYVYADPDGCHCLYLGDDKAYQSYQRLAVEKQIADEHLRAAQMEQSASLNWGLWGPGFWGPGPIVVLRR